LSTRKPTYPAGSGGGGRSRTLPFACLLYEPEGWEAEGRGGRYLTFNGSQRVRSGRSPLPPSPAFGCLIPFLRLVIPSLCCGYCRLRCGDPLSDPCRRQQGPPPSTSPASTPLADHRPDRHLPASAADAPRPDIGKLFFFNIRKLAATPLVAHILGRHELNHRPYIPCSLAPASGSRPRLSRNPCSGKGPWRPTSSFPWRPLKSTLAPPE
jgi:hypothetical protein